MKLLNRYQVSSRNLVSSEWLFFHECFVAAVAKQTRIAQSCDADDNADQGERIGRQKCGLGARVELRAERLQGKTTDLERAHTRAGGTR